MIKFFKNIKLYKHGRQNYNFKIKKLNSNENPFPPSIKIIKHLIREIKYFGNILRFYPDSNSLNIKRILSKFYNLKIENLFVGNGSDEIIGFLFFYLFKINNYLKLNNLTYIFYESYIKLYNIKYKIIKLNKNFIKNKFKYNNSNIILTNPSVPSGLIINKYTLEKFIINNISSVIILDETYMDFYCNYFIKLIDIYKNIIILKTLSKSRSLAGIRLGIALSNINFIKILNCIKNSFNTYPVNILTQTISEYSYKDLYYFKKINNIINFNKIYLIKFFKKKNLITFNSKSNFIIIKLKKNININIIKKLFEKNYLYIRKFEIPKLENYIRITIGIKRDCLKIIKLFKIK